MGGAANRSAPFLLSKKYIASKIFIYKIENFSTVI